MSKKHKHPSARVIVAGLYGQATVQQAILCHYTLRQLSDTLGIPPPSEADDTWAEQLCTGLQDFMEHTWGHVKLLRQIPMPRLRRELRTLDQGDGLGLQLTMLVEVELDEDSYVMALIPLPRAWIEELPAHIVLGMQKITNPGDDTEEDKHNGKS